MEKALRGDGLEGLRPERMVTAFDCARRSCHPHSDDLAFRGGEEPLCVAFGKLRLAVRSQYLMWEADLVDLDCRRARSFLLQAELGWRDGGVCAFPQN